MRVKRPNSATIIAFVALFALVASTAYAASLPKNSVSNRSIKKNAVTGKKVKNDSLTGKDIKESTLSTVPKAANAESIGGLSAAQLAKSDSWVTYNVHLPEGQERALVSFGPFTVIARCVVAAPGVAAQIRVNTTGSGGYLYLVPGAVSDNDFTTPEHKLTTLSTSTPPARFTHSFDLMDPASGIAGAGSVKIFLNFGSAETCRFAGSAVIERP